MMSYKGVEFTVSMTGNPDVWQWQFQIGSATKSGKTEAKLELLAVRRIQSQIDRELRKLARATNEAPRARADTATAPLPR
jgi:hypothetical protein